MTLKDKLLNLITVIFFICGCSTGNVTYAKKADFENVAREFYKLGLTCGLSANLNEEKCLELLEFAISK